MLTNLKISGFRGFVHLRMEGLKRVNLLVGANNAGKTSILEAAELLAMGAPKSLFRSPQRRGEEAVSFVEEDRPLGPAGTALDLSHMFHGHSIHPGVRFSIEGDGSPQGPYRVDVVSGSIDADGPEGEVPLPIPGLEPLGPDLALKVRSTSISRPTRIKISADGFVSQDTRRRLSEPSLKAETKVQFLGTDKVDDYRLGFLWDGVVLTAEEGKVIEALKLIEPGIERLAFLSDSRRFNRRSIALKMTGAEQRIPLGSAGDGLKRLLALALHLISSSEGFLFVDEIDTGLHFNVMFNMWKLLIETAKRLNVQVFATTHSLDCVQALAQVWDKLPDCKEDVAVHRVERNLESTSSFTIQEINTATRSHIEVR